MILDTQRAIVKGSTIIACVTGRLFLREILPDNSFILEFVDRMDFSSPDRCRFAAATTVELGGEYVETVADPGPL